MSFPKRVRLLSFYSADGLLYLPEIKYRRILNKAFGPGGWGLAPRSETNVGPKIVSREYALVCLGRSVYCGYLSLKATELVVRRLVSVARGEQEYFDPSGIPTATEACKSNALMRCCKDLGIASELWYALARYTQVFWTLMSTVQGPSLHTRIQGKVLRGCLRRRH